MLYFVTYFLVINLLAFVLCAVDKSRARKRQWRIPERTLFLCSALGGAFGFYLGMRLFRHKTKHRSFTIGIPLLGIAWIGILAYAGTHATFL